MTDTFRGLIKVLCPTCGRLFRTPDGSLPMPHVHVLGGTCAGNQAGDRQ